MSSPFKTGAVVHMLPHDLVFAADLWAVEGAVVVKANGPIVRGGNAFPANSKLCERHVVTHTLSDNIASEYWNPSIGIFIVPARCLVEAKHDAA